MSDGLSADHVRKIARLSRLVLSDVQIERLRQDLSAVVTYVDRLRALDLSDVEPLVNVGGGVNRLRDDEPGPTISADQFMSMAPDAMPPFLRVPKVLDGESS